jgi:hypothetical protein
MLGPVYRYDASNPSTAKLPSYFDGKLFIFEFSRSLIHTVQVDADGKLDKVERFWYQTTSNPIQNPIDCKVGPDGALYFLDWSDNGSYPHNSGHGNLVKLEYTGPAEPVRPAPALAPQLGAGWSLLAPGQGWNPPEGALRADAFDPQGRRMWSWSSGAPDAAPAPASRMLRVRITTAARR